MVAGSAGRVWCAQLAALAHTGRHAAASALAALGASAPAAQYATAAKPGAKAPAASGSLRKLGLTHVKDIIAVSSAKGGVGKSTTAVNLAVSLATRLGLKTGLLDADIHGPSVGRMMNLSGKPPVEQGTQLILPLENYRVKTMSMSYFMESEDTPAVWRGPMSSKAFDKISFGTAWGALDVLVVDLPPGTGDAQINLAQRIPLSGAIIVSTPQDIALMDAKRGTTLFRKMGVPILGMVENMSFHVCTNCGHKEYTFGQEGVLRTAEQYGLEVLGQLPLDLRVREQADIGAPIAISQPDHPCAQAYFKLAERVMTALKDRQGMGASQGPTITFE